MLKMTIDKNQWIDRKSEDIIEFFNDFLLTRNVKIPNKDREKDEMSIGTEIFSSIYGLDYEYLKMKLVDILEKEEY